MNCQHKKLNGWVDEVAALCQPKPFTGATGVARYDRLMGQAVRGKAIPVENGPTVFFSVPILVM
jgi:hypothetical protein